MITINDVEFFYPNFKIVCPNLEISEGEVVAVTGNNGSGKTTFLKLISGHIKPKRGKILFNGSTKDKSDIRVGVVFQNPDNQIIFNNVYDDICFTLKNFKISKEEFNARVDEALGVVKMSEFKNSETMNLSTGQKQRIVIANMLAISPKVLLLDEVTAYLDAETKLIIYNLLGELKKRGVTVIFCTNQLDEIVFADRVLVFDKGNMVADKSRDDALADLSIFGAAELPLKLRILNKIKGNARFDGELFDLIKDKL